MNNDSDKIDYEDYFFTKFSSDISDLFLNIKEISDGFCVNIFNTKNQIQKGSYELSKFIFENIILEGEIIDENNSNKENHELEEENIVL